jgi:hypothetical protein
MTTGHIGYLFNPRVNIFAQKIEAVSKNAQQKAGALSRRRDGRVIYNRERSEFSLAADEKL